MGRRRVRLRSWWCAAYTGRRGMILSLRVPFSLPLQLLHPAFQFSQRARMSAIASCAFCSHLRRSS